MKIEIIAEIGSNWEGSIAKAEKIIKACKKAGADAVKFQMWRAEDLYSKDMPEWKNIKKSEIDFGIARKLKRISDKNQIEFFCSVFYPEAVDFLESLNVKKYKIASRTCVYMDPFDKETMKKVSKTKKPVIISMGLGGNKNKISKIFKTKKTFCYCISEYPLEFEKMNWNDAIKFDGLSDHTLGITAPIMFATFKKYQGRKSIIIEKHVKLPNTKGPDAPTSIDTNQLAELVSHIRLIEKAKFQ